MRRLISCIAIATVCLTGSSAFGQLGAVTDTAKKAGTVTKEAGKTTADVTEHAAKSTAKGTKKVAEGTKDAVQTTWACADGTTDKAALKADACTHHGGVKAKDAVKR